MTCPRCNSENVKIDMIQSQIKYKHTDRGIIWKLTRLLLIVCTGGLWLIFGKSKGTSKSKIKYEKKAICQECGNAWTIN